MGLAWIQEAYSSKRMLNIYLVAFVQQISESKSSIFFFNTPPII